MIASAPSLATLGPSVIAAGAQGGRVRACQPCSWVLGREHSVGIWGDIDTPRSLV